MSDQTIAGAILAGGQARRLAGQDKCRLVIEGHSIIVRQTELLQRVAAEIFVVTTAEDRAARPARFSDLPYPVYTDVVPGAGALGGIHAALEHASADRVLVLACDLPFLTAGLLRALADLAMTGDGAWVHGARGVEPLIACYRRHARQAIRAALSAGHLKAAALANVLDLRELDHEALSAFGDPARLLANVNTPDDVRRVQ